MELLIKTKLTPEVLEGLKDGKIYHCVANKKDPKTGHDDGSETGWWLKKHGLDARKECYTHIYLPLTVTEQMVEEAADSDYSYGKAGEIGSRARSLYEEKKDSFTSAINWLLSINKDKK